MMTAIFVIALIAWIAQLLTEGDVNLFMLAILVISCWGFSIGWAVAFIVISVIVLLLHLSVRN